MIVVLRLLVIFAILLAGDPSLARGGATVRGRAADRQRYVRVSDWARANKFTLRSLDRGRTLQLSNRWARITFNTDPRQNLRRAGINGVETWLAFPLSFQNGAACLSQLDVEKTLTPVLSPRTNPPGIKVRTICLDPGHGGKDPGYRIGSREEQQYTLLLALELRDQLQRAGFKVVLTRSADVYVDLPNRPALAKKRKADLFVSLHFNAHNGARSDAQGIETYCLTPEGATSTNAGGEGNTRRVTGNGQDDRNMLLAYKVQKALLQGLGAQDRGVRRARYQVLREAQMPAVLIEGGFLSHPVEGRKISEAAFRRQMARAIVDGILAYQRAVKG